VRHDDRAAAGRRRDRTPLPVVLAACGVLLLITMTAGVGIGSVALSPAAVWQVIAGHLSGHAENTVAGTIVWQIRLPRVLLAAVVGAARTTAGAVVQGGSWRAGRPARSSRPRRSGPPTARTSWSSSIRTPARRI
jgi:ABC-type enterobactin transport system permease subunit